MVLSERLRWLADRTAKVLGVSEEEAIEASLRFTLQKFERSQAAIEGGITSEQVLTAASTRQETFQGFTLDELLDDLYADAPIFSPHKVKIQMGKLLTLSGYHRKQIRRSSNDRPLWWFKNPGRVQ